jgi:hypothetical protein
MRLSSYRSLMWFSVNPHGTTSESYTLCGFCLETIHSHLPGKSRSQPCVFPVTGFWYLGKEYLPELVISGLKNFCLSNALDSSEDDVIRQNCGKESSSENVVKEM